MDQQFTEEELDLLTIEVLRRDALHATPAKPFLVAATDADAHVIAASGISWLHELTPNTPWPAALAVSADNVLSGGPQPPALYLAAGQLFTTERANLLDLTFEQFAAITGYAPPD